MAGGGRNGKGNGNSNAGWSTLPGRQRLSWCPKNKLCRYCQDWIDVQLHGKPNTLRQACTQRPAGVKKERGLNLSATNTSLSALKPRRVTVKDIKHSSEGILTRREGEEQGEKKPRSDKKRKKT
jgi:hypothetical protein